jgi:hypothetical protein
MSTFLVWILGTFIYFKVAFDFAFFRDITIIAALLLSLITSINVYISARFYARNLGRSLAGSYFSSKNNKFTGNILIFLSSLTTNAIIAKLIIFGFSKRKGGMNLFCY